MYNFGSGFLYGVQTTDATGAAVANPTPVQFGVLQDVSVDFSFENKMLYGQSQFPVAVGRGKGKITGKAKFGNIAGSQFNSMFFGASAANNIVSAVNALGAGKAIPTTPFTLTAGTTENATTFAMPGVTPTFVRDLGVRYVATGLPLTRVQSAPAVGQYTVSGAGAYVFNTADAGLFVLISYEYQSTLASPRQFTISNQAMGYAPQFLCILNSQYNGGYMHLRLPACISSKLGLATKNDDFTIPELEFDAFADASGTVGVMSFSEF